MSIYDSLNFWEMGKREKFKSMDNDISLKQKRNNFETSFRIELTLEQHGFQLHGDSFQ